jgi:hypothetical protein
MTNVIPFPTRSKSDDVARIAAFSEGSVDPNHLAASLGTPEEWRWTAIDYLKAASCCPAPDGVIVSQAALHIILAYVESLEGRLGIIPAPPGAP